MNFADVRKKEGRISGLVSLERLVSRQNRSRIKKVLFGLVPVMMMWLLVLEEQSFVSVNVLLGLILFAVASWLILFMVDAFYYSRYFKGEHYAIKEWGLRRYEQATIPFEVLEIVSNTLTTDFTAGFLTSRPGREIMERLNIDQEQIRSFLSGDRQKVYAEPITFPTSLTLATYARVVFESDKDFAEFLVHCRVRLADFVAAAVWIGDIYERQKKSFRWWGRDSLGRIKGVGKDWSSGDTYLLEKYGHFVAPQNNELLFKKEIDDLERSLTRSAGIDALLVAKEKSDLMSVISGLAARIRDGSALPHLEHKRILSLDIEVIDKISVTEGHFETMIIRLLNEAVMAGNLIIVIPNISQFISLTRKHKADLSHVLDPYFASSSLHLVALSTEGALANIPTTDAENVKKFNKIIIGGGEKSSVFRALENMIYTLERKYRLFFTYQSLQAIIEATERYFGSEDIEIRALVLLDEIAPTLIKHKIKKVTADHIRELRK